MLKKSALLIILATPAATAWGVESIHFGYIDANASMTDSLRLPTRSGTLWWSANKQRYNAEDGSPVAYSYHDGYVENGFSTGATSHTPTEAAARWRSIMTGNGDPWTGQTGAQIGTPSIIILDELVSNFSDGSYGTQLRDALQQYLAYPGATRNDIAAFLSPGFCQSTSIVASNYDDLIYSANNYMRMILPEVYSTQAGFNSGGDTYLATQLGAPLRKWTTTFGIAASRVQPTLQVSNISGADSLAYNQYLNREFQFMANGWYTAAHAVDNNVRTAMRTGVSSYTWSVGTGTSQLLSTITTRDAYFEEFLNWYSVLGNTALDNFWVADADGSWSTSGNWLTAAAPSGVDAYAKFIFPITAPRSIAVSGGTTAGHLVFDNVNSYTLGGAGALTMQVASGGADVTVSSGSHTIAVPVALNSYTTFNIAGGSTLSLTAQLSGSGTIAKSGAGTLRLTNARSSTVNITGGEIEIIAAGTNAGASKITNLSLTNGGKLDLQNNALVLVNTTAGTWNGSGYTGVTGMVAAGRNAGNWDGSGIVTGMTSALGAVPLSTIGVAPNSVLNKSTFMGQTVSTSDVLLAYTFAGDANLSGTVDGDDYFFIDNGYATQTNGWINGDFNYDGKVNADDYFLIDRSYARQGAGLGGSLAAVPEPAMGMIGIGAMLVASQRRRRASR